MWRRQLKALRLALRRTCSDRRGGAVGAAQVLLRTESETLFHMPEVVLPTAATPAIIARKIKARMNPYSTTVAPLVELANLLMNCSPLSHPASGSSS